MAPLNQKTVEDLIARARKPARYMGRELNIIIREGARLRMALSYPDLYEVGMSNSGVGVLYDIVNGIPGAACERVFAVEADFEAILREEGVPLYTLETYTPLSETDIIGFNLSHELLCTNVLQILDLGGVPLRGEERRDGDPIVIAGGGAVSNPFPMFDFIDAFFIGDGEEGVVDIVRTALDAKERGLSRAETIERIGGVEGVLLPSRYRFINEGPRTMVEGPAVRRRVHRGGISCPPRPLVPNIRIAQERVTLEVARGCTNFCNFCHAGFYDLPYRFCDPRAAADRLREMVRATGYQEVTLSALSIGDYPRLVELINAVLPELTGRGMSVSFPSLRVDAATLPIIERISELRRASLTFAVESGSEEIRARANKRLFAGDLLDIIRRARELGWKVIKLYFMLGLPGCDENDEAAAIAALLAGVRRAGGGMEINVTVSPFVPKPHTPFQRERQMGRDYFEEALRRIRRALPRSVTLKPHNLDASTLEGIIARGDARLGRVVLQSYRDGCRLDSWDEHFRFDLWRKNLDGLLPGWERFLERRGGEELPWGRIVTGFERLVESRTGATALRERVRRPGMPDAGPLDEARQRFAARFAVAGRMRFRIAKTGMMRFISHIDFMEIVKRALRMADAPIAMTQGFNKRERLSSGYPVPLGIESEAELVDADIFTAPADDLAVRMNGRLPAGIEVTGARLIEDREPVMAATAVVEYRVEASAEARAALLAGMAAGAPFTRRAKGNERIVPYAAVVHSSEARDDGAVIIRLHAGSPDSLRADEAVCALAGMRDGRPGGMRIVKTAQYRLKDGGLEIIN